MLTNFLPPTKTESERLALFADEAPATKLEALKIVTHAQRVRAWGWAAAAVLAVLAAVLVELGVLKWPW